MGGLPLPTDCFLRQYDVCKVVDSRKVWASPDRGRFYTWDSAHGEIEVFDRRGKHIAVVDPISGNVIKPAVEGRKINV